MYSFLKFADQSFLGPTTLKIIYVDHQKCPEFSVFKRTVYIWVPVSRLQVIEQTNFTFCRNPHHNDEMQNNEKGKEFDLE